MSPASWRVPASNVQSRTTEGRLRRGRRMERRRLEPNRRAGNAAYANDCLELPGPSRPAAAATERLGGERGHEPGPLEVDEPGGVGGQLRPPKLLDLQARRPERAGLPQHEPKVLEPLRGSADPRQVRRPVDSERVALPRETLDERRGRELGAEAEDPPRDREPRVRHLLVLEAQHLEELGQRLAAQELPLQPLDRQRLVECRAVRPAEELGREVQEDAAVLLVRRVEDVEEVPEVIRDDSAVVAR